MTEEKHMWMSLFRRPDNGQWQWKGISNHAWDERSVDYFRSQGYIVRIDEFERTDDRVTQYGLIDDCYYHHNGDGVDSIPGYVGSTVYQPETV